MADRTPPTAVFPDFAPRRASLRERLAARVLGSKSIGVDVAADGHETTVEAYQHNGCVYITDIRHTERSGST